MIGYTAQKYTWEGSDLSGTDFPDDDISWIDAAATKNGTSTMSTMGDGFFHWKG